MKANFKPGWNKSVQKRKQRKYRFNAPAHKRGAFLNAPLEKSLREKHGRRTLRVRVGDEVEVMRGSFKGVTGEVDEVDTKKSRLVIRGAEFVKDDGTKRPNPIAASNVKILKLAEERRRMK